MKKFLNVLLSIMLLSSMMFVLSACGEDETKDNENLNYVVDEKEDSENNVEEENKNENKNEEENVIRTEDGIKYTSTEDSLIVEEEASGMTITFKFDGQKVVGCSLTMEASTEEEAQTVKSEMEANEQIAGLYKMTLDGKKIIMEYTQAGIDAEFSTQTRESIEKTLLSDEI